MINAKMYDFYGVALSSVEVALKLRAVGSIAPFFSSGFKLYSIFFYKFLSFGFRANKITIYNR